MLVSAGGKTVVLIAQIVGIVRSFVFQFVVRTAWGHRASSLCVERGSDCSSACLSIYGACICMTHNGQPDNSLTDDNSLYCSTSSSSRRTIEGIILHKSTSAVGPCLLEVG